MKAVFYPKYGSPDVLELREVDIPVPKDHQVLIKVQAASANALDYRRFESTTLIGRLMETLLVKGTNKVLGADLAGTVEAAGASVEHFKPGDAVFGLSAGSVGAFAEYVCASQKALALKPEGVSFEQAAAVPVAGLTALQAIRDHGQVQPGQQVLIQGASGGVGTFAVQIARYYGAQVTAVCSPRNAEQALALGASQVIDYTRQDFTRTGQRYDFILAVNGFHPLTAYRRALLPGGVYLAAGGSFGQILQAMLLGRLFSRQGGRKMGFMGLARVNPEDLAFLAGLLAGGQVKAAIERRYPLSQTADALRYLAQGHAQGKVVIQVAE